MEKNNLSFDKNKVWLAELKYYSKENNGVEVGDALSYAFMVNVGEDQYVNPFCIGVDYPVFKRTCYANYTQSGESYGTKLILANNINETGPCYILSKNASDLEFIGDVITLEQLKDYMFRSSEYFKDRKQFVEDRFKGRPFKMYKFITEDEAKEVLMKNFLAERKAHVKLIK